jgi:PKD repeat protein
VAYSSPGTYVASFTVTDNGGLTSQPATRTVVVTDFSLSATPASQAVDPGSRPTYTATVTPGPGFTGVVTFGVTGLPAGATAAFAPGSVTGSGTTTLTVATIASTPSGTYPLRITATSGPVSHSFDVTLVVNVVVVGDFTITATPASRTIQNGNSTTYSVAIAPNQGFSSSVTLSVGALPKSTTATFSPTSLASGASTLTLSTKKQTKPGSYSVVITASGGGRTHTSTVILVVQ